MERERERGCGRLTCARHTTRVAISCTTGGRAGIFGRPGSPAMPKPAMPPPSPRGRVLAPVPIPMNWEGEDGVRRWGGRGVGVGGVVYLHGYLLLRLG